MSLKEYQRKRNFNRTTEPEGKRASKRGWLFVVQKHAASRLHYDFRLELNGVLKSWAVPKGPSYNPKDKRLAVHVEDHPIEYGSFEGIIPEGEYGGGTVLLWDRGTWEPVGDPEAGYHKGKLKFLLHGQKLQGGWVLVRPGGRRSAKEEGKGWFLIKEQDEYARSVGDADVLEEDLTVSTDRRLEEIAEAKDRVWRVGKASSSRAKSQNGMKVGATFSKSIQKEVAGLPGVRKGKLPKPTEPQLATLTRDAPEGDEWLHEIKFDGYRMLCRIEDGRAEFISRNGQNWSHKLDDLVHAALRLPARQALLDGEVVALTSNGTSNFQSLQNAFKEGKGSELLYHAFDLLFLDGMDLRQVALEQRKRVLAELILKASGGPIRYTEHIVGDGHRFFNEACKLGLEGVISKRRDRPYAKGRGIDWLKTKCIQNEEFVIGGYTEPSGSRAGLGALLIGYYDDQGMLRYSGKVGTGFSGKTLRDLPGMLEPLEQADSSFSDLTRRAGPARSAHWVKPELICQVQFSNWTKDGRLRHPSFQGLREDKTPREVVRREPLSLNAAFGKASRQRSALGKGNLQPATAPSAHRRSLKPANNSKARLPADVALSSPDKVLYPELGITKLDLARYYTQVGKWMLPHVKGRSVVLVRCPEGQDEDCFYQKHPGAGTPDTLRQIPIREKEKTANYLVVDNLAGLVSLVQLGALEIHVWGSTANKLERPDRLIFDLDPDPAVPWKRVSQSAIQIREFLSELGLVSFVKTTGGKGLHLIVPMKRRHEWSEVKEFCRAVAEAIEQADPAHYTANMSKSVRKGKIFIDYLRNERGATSVAAYSARAKPGATVSVPVSWKEVEAGIASDHFTVTNLPEQLASRKSDPWKQIGSVKQMISKTAKQILGL